MFIGVYFRQAREERKMFFKNCNNLEELKKEYRRLILLHHPDRGGNEETMKQVNAEYEKMFNLLKNKKKAEQTKTSEQETTETPQEFIHIMEKLITLEGLNIELCGSWLWISGNTYQHKDALRALGCMWSRSKQKWYWHGAEQAKKHRRSGTASMSQIRARYGSEILTQQAQQSRPKALRA